MPSHHRRGSLAIRVLTALIAILCALGLGACGNTLQDQPIPHNELEDLLLAPYPVYWLGGSFHGLQITEAARDPSGSFIVQYGDCLEGGQSVCVTPLKIITSPDNSFVPGEGPATSRRSASLRGTDGFIAERGDAISIPTGPVVVDIYAHTPEARPGRGRHGRPGQLPRRARCQAGLAAAEHRLWRTSAALPGAQSVEVPRLDNG